MPDALKMRSIKLGTVLGLTAIFFITQIIASHVTHSLTLLINAYQMLYNIVCLLGSVAAIKMSSEQTLRNTFGWARIEVLSMLCSVLLLAALCFSVFVEAVQTLVHLLHQDAMHHPLFVLAIAFFGVLLNLLCFVLLGGYTHQQGCFLHVQGSEVEVTIVRTEDPIQFRTEHPTRFQLMDFARDVSASVILIACSCLVYFFEGDVALYADPLFSVLAAFLLLASSYPFVTQSSLILLQTVPENVDVDSLKKRFITKFPSILNVHDVHVWRLTRDKIIATAHVVCMAPEEYRKISSSIGEFFLKEGISLATIQPEFIQCVMGNRIQSKTCVLGCGNKKCQAQHCCPLDEHKDEENKEENKDEQTEDNVA